MPICHLSLSKFPSTLCGHFKLSALQLFGLKDHDFGFEIFFNSSKMVLMDRIMRRAEKREVKQE